MLIYISNIRLCKHLSEGRGIYNKHRAQLIPIHSFRKHLLNSYDALRLILACGIQRLNMLKKKVSIPKEFAVRSQGKNVTFVEKSCAQVLYLPLAS